MAEFTKTSFYKFLEGKSRVVVLTGAGISAGAGIPTYRDQQGNWQRSDPIQHQDFLRQHTSRQRYWLRSYIGWPAVAKASPCLSHRALAELESSGPVNLIVTQNVDRLHQKAGANAVIDLHGRLDRVICLSCKKLYARSAIQEKLKTLNPFLETLNQEADIAPDGDANIETAWVSEMTTPRCEHCDGDLKPDVVFFGDNVPKSIVQSIYRTLDDADGFLIVGTSLKVFSGFRFCRYAFERHLDIASINPGVTRGDNLIATHIHSGADEVLADYLSARSTA
ncbi:MAG: NAD-dependent protein deacetylase [Pseudomonadales bacterium]|nr:NAD-dependent protein deacetylase [Pseudomonadales bacterium]MBO6595641.1 NAD-dependent protein deacetylase [Pseudomonadales bacterium]MBO6820801.1 NAD-dependent protein deacetylase [Pseudomonadales bacterium]